MPLYNHAFDIAFEVINCPDKEGEDINASQFRWAIMNRIANLSDSELIEAIGAPFDSYEQERKQ